MACSTHGREEKCIQGFYGKTRRKRPLAKLRRRWEVNIKMGDREIRWCDMDWIHLAEETNGGLLLVL
jgi:hypothetical protein